MLPPPPDAKWFARLQGKPCGPFDMEQLRRLVAERRLRPHHHLSMDQKTWFEASKLAELFAAKPLLNRTQPAPTSAEQAPTFAITCTCGAPFEIAGPLTDEPVGCPACQALTFVSALSSSQMCASVAEPVVWQCPCGLKRHLPRSKVGRASRCKECQHLFVIVVPVGAHEKPALPQEAAATLQLYESFLEEDRAATHAREQEDKLAPRRAPSSTGDDTWATAGLLTALVTGINPLAGLAQGWLMNKMVDGVERAAPTLLRPDIVAIREERARAEGARRQLLAELAARGYPQQLETLNEIMRLLRNSDVAALVKLLTQDGDATKRAGAAAALADLGGPLECLPAAANNLADMDPGVRLSCVRILGVRNDQQQTVKSRLFLALNDKDCQVALGAAAALCQRAPDDPRLCDWLLGRLHKPPAGAADTFQVKILRLLGELGPYAAHAWPAVRPLLNSSTNVLRAEAALAATFLAASPAQICPILIGLMGAPNAEYRLAAAAAIAALGPRGRGCRSELARLVSDENPQVRLHVALAMGRMGLATPTAIGALHALSVDKYWLVQEAALRGLRRLSEDVGPTLEAILSKEGDMAPERFEQLRREQMRFNLGKTTQASSRALLVKRLFTLGRVPQFTEQTASLMVDILRGPDEPLVRQIAAGFLGQVSAHQHEMADVLYATVVSDPHEQICREALEALGELLPASMARLAKLATAAPTWIREGVAAILLYQPAVPPSALAVLRTLLADKNLRIRCAAALAVAHHGAGKLEVVRTLQDAAQESTNGPIRDVLVRLAGEASSDGFS